MVGATFISCARPCADSSAGMMPSIRVQSWKASRASSSVIGTELRAQFQESEGKLPDAVVACVGGGSNAIGTFHAFLDDPTVKLYGAEAGGHGIDTENGHAA